MAISGGDGSIVLTTKVDQSGLNKSMASMQKGVKSLSNSFKALGSTIAAVFSIAAIINFSKQAGEFATQTEASVQRLVDIYGEAAESVGNFIDANARAIGMSKASASSFASVYGNLFSVWADQNTNAELTNRYLNMTAVVASKTGRTVQDVQERVRSGLLGNTEAIEDLGVFVNVKTIEMTDAFQRMADGRSWEQLGAYEQQQIRSMAILEQATAKYGNTVADTTATTRAQYQAAYEDFQNTWGQVVNTVLIPVLKILTQVFTIATKGLQVMAGLSGKTVEHSGQTSNNIKQQTKEQEKLNKAVKKGLAGFDEINALTEQSAENTADAGTGTQISGIGGVGGNYDNSFVDKIDADLAAIMGAVGFALAAIGIIMICFGHIGWGIGFLIAGAAIFSVSQAALSENEATQKVRNQMNAIIGIGSFLLFAIGVILCCCGIITPLSIGMIIVGAAGMVTEVAINWNLLKKKIVDIFMGLDIKKSLMLIGLGILLVCTTIGTGLGVALIALGAAGIVKEVVVNWNSITETVKNIFNSVVSWVKTWGLLVLGILLVMGGFFSLGIPMIVAGGANLVEAKSPVWTSFLDKLKEVWGKIKAYWNSNVAKYFTSNYWSQKGKNMINGLISKIVEGFNALASKINRFGFNLPDILGGGRISFNVPKLSIPKLARGAVIPPNREFLAVLGDQKHGTNIEAPLDTIKQAVAEVLAQVNVGGSGSFNGRIEVPVIIDGREVARAVREAEGSMGTQTVFGGFANVY